jgi:hypothetical protein
MNSNNEITQYICSTETSGAILLTGKWGSGKTYYINKLVSELNKTSENAAIVISLFGHDHTITVERKIKENILDFSIGVEASSTVKKGYSLLKNLAKIGSINSVIKDGINTAISIDIFEFIKIEKQIAVHKNTGDAKAKLILIFDDFERTRIDHENMLGMINNFVENIGIKVIIIADEERINSPKYNEYKEKIISRTVRLIPRVSEVIDGIFENYNETAHGYKEFLKGCKRIIENVFMESESQNIRTLKSMIIDFERVYSCWPKSEIPYDHMENVFYTFGAYLFYTNIDKNQSSNDKKIVSDHALSDKYTNYGAHSSELRSLQLWINSGDWDESLVVRELKDKYGIKSYSFDEQFLSAYLWDLSSETIMKGLPLVIERARMGNLSCDELISLILKLDSLTTYGVRLPIEINYNEIIDGLNIREKRIMSGEINEPKKYTFIDENTLKDIHSDAVKLYRKIEKIDNNIIAWDNRRNLMSYLDNRENYSRNDFGANLILSFDNELATKLLDRYFSSNNRNKRELALVFEKLVFDDVRYSNVEDITDSRNEFERIKEILLARILSENDEITKVIMYEFIKLINNKIDKFDSILSK